MTELLTAAQMRAIEKAAIDSGEVTGLELMERAGRGVVEAIFEEWPELAKASHRAVVLCGPGNNGGDGFVVARLLKEWGWEVEVFLYGDPEKLPPDARVNYERWVAAEEVTPIVEDGEVSLRDYDSVQVDVFVDALFGTGITRPVKGILAEDFLGVLSGQIAGAETWPVNPAHRIVAVDCPSGLCSDSGRVLAESRYPIVASADLTVTFHAAKRGHHLSLGSRICGRLVLKDIGLHKTRFPIRLEFRTPSDRRGANVLLTDPNSRRQMLLPTLSKSVAIRRGIHAENHKYGHGHALILSGSPGKTGAARLAARGALRIGAGLVTIACPEDALPEVAAQTTAIMCHPLPSADALRETLKDQRLNALCLGPGLGLDDRATDVLCIALGKVPDQVRGVEGKDAPAPEPGPPAKRAIVLDADALTLIARNPELFVLLHDQCVLTPHAGEFKRLFPDIAAKLEEPATKGPAYSKVDATRDAAKRAGCTILFKGPDTVIADPHGRAAINSSAYERSAPWLATAGSGDVLAGFITGLLARGFAPMQAAETAAWLHTECALKFGPGLIAEDLPEILPAVLKDLLSPSI